MWEVFIRGCKEHHLTRYNCVSCSHLYVAEAEMVVESLRSRDWFPMASLQRVTEALGNGLSVIAHMVPLYNVS